MPSSLTQPRTFTPGTTGWTAADLDDPDIERQWFNGRYEIVEGVLATMPPAYFLAGQALQKLIYRVTRHIGEEAGSFAAEVDIIIDDCRIARADAVFMTLAQETRQNEAALAAGHTDPARTRILIPPTLIIESLSPGHEQHDQRTKRRWYAEFGVANYWLLDPFKRTLQCLVLRDGSYHDDAYGQANDEVRPSLFPGLILRLGELWNA